jgi:mRNA interferase RelE/StbE
MKWIVKFLPEAVEELRKIDNSVRKRILSTIPRLENDPIGHGTPLGRRYGLDLTSFYKLTPVGGYRVVYFVQKREVIVTIVSVGKREKEKAYKAAAERIKGLRLETNVELQRIDSLLAE